MIATMKTLKVQATDVGGHNRVNVNDVASDSTVGELVQALLPRMRLAQKDPEGRPLTYHALLEREGRHLHKSETVGEALQPGDSIVLQPYIQAGRF